MNVVRVLALHGANRWTTESVLEVEITPASADDALLEAIRAFRNELGDPPGYGTVSPSADGAHVVFAFDEEPVGRAYLDAAAKKVRAEAAGEPFDSTAALATVRKTAHDYRLGPSTRSITDAAARRGIPVRRLNSGSLVQLGWGRKQKRIWTAETDDTPALAEHVAQDKQITRDLLAGVGVPVPWGRPVTDAEDAWECAEYAGLPVVVKPRFGNQGKGVATDLRTKEQVAAAYAAARQIAPDVVVETHAPGRDYRLLVIGGKLAAAALREPAHVVGNGRSTIAELIAVVNTDPRRSDGHGTALSWIKLDPVALGVLADQGYGPDSVLPAGVRVLIRRNANLSTGGTATDVTDLVHPDVAADAITAARTLGLDVAGVDVVAEDISRPLAEQRGAIVEVNAGPGLRMHLEPSAGSPRDVGAAVVDALFPPGETGRVPVVAVVGTANASQVARHVAQQYETDGRHVVVACRDGLFLGGRRTDPRDCANHAGTAAALLNPRADVVVLEVAPSFFRDHGLGIDRCDVLVAADGDDETTATIHALRAAHATNGAVVPSSNGPPTADELSEAVKGTARQPGFAGLK